MPRRLSLPLVALVLVAPRVAVADADVRALRHADVVRLARRAPAAERAAVAQQLAEAGVDAADERPWSLGLDAGTAPVDLERPPPGGPGSYREASLAHRFVTGTALEVLAHDGVASPVAEAGRSLTLALTQPLVRGVWPAAVDARARAAGHEARAAALRARADTDALVAAASAAYWQLAFAQEDVDVRRASVEAARQQLRLTGTLVKAGQVPRTALLAAQQAVDVRAAAVIAAERAQLERAVALRGLLGLPIDPRQPLLVAADALAELPDAPDDATALATAARTSPEVGEARARRDTARARVAGADDRARPQVDLRAALVWAPPPAEPDGRTSAPDDALVGTLSLSLRHDLGGAARGARRQARASARLAELDLAEARRRVEAQVALARATLDAARRRRALTAQVAERAETLAEAEAARFTAGGATVFDVLARQDELEAARREQLRASLELAIARAELTRLRASEGRP